MFLRDLLRKKIIDVKRYERSNADSFGKSQFQCSKNPAIDYMIYRWTFAILMICILISSMVDAGRETVLCAKLKWPIYLTNWGFTVCTTQSILGAIITSTMYYRHTSLKEGTNVDLEVSYFRNLVVSSRGTTISDMINSMPVTSITISTIYYNLLLSSTSITMALGITAVYWLSVYNPDVSTEKFSKIYKLYSALQSTSITMALGITAVYWLSVYNPEEHTIDGINILVHACNSILMIIDIIVSSHPIKLYHIGYPVIFVCSYAVFNGIYYLCGGTDKKGNIYIYKIMNWQQPEKCFVVILGGIIFVIILYFFIWLFVCLKRSCFTKIKIRWNKNKYFVEETNMSEMKDTNATTIA